MGYTIAICDDDKNMADKLTVSLKNEFMKAGRNDVIIDYYDTGVQLLEALKNKMYKSSTPGHQHGAYGWILGSRGYWKIRIQD